MCSPKTAALVCAGVLLLLCPREGWSQASTATFHGAVFDATEGAIAGAAATLRDESTQATLRRTTDATGNFVFTFVPVGVYTLRIEAPGFKAFTTTGIGLRAGQQARQRFVLDVGDVTETVTVEGAATLVNTVSAEQHHSFDSTQVQELPLQNRNFTRLLDLTPGAVPSTGASQGVNLSGVGTHGTQYSLDGTNASGNVGASSPGAYQSPNLIDVMSVEGIEDVSVIKGVIPAEFKNATGGQVNLISKSGTNQWHGSLFHNHRNRVLNARFQPLATRPPLVFNQFGGSLGGPILKDKIFIFGIYEGYRESEGAFVRGNVPTQSFRNQMLNAVPAYQSNLDGLPLPNSPHAPDAIVGLYTSAKAAERYDDHFDFRGDVLLTDSSRLTASYNRGRPVRSIPRVDIDNDRSWTNSLDRIAVNYIVTKVELVSETRFGFNRTIQDRGDARYALRAPGSPEESFLGAQRLPRFTTALGFSGPFAENNHSGGPFWQISQKFALERGRHFIKFGGDFNRLTGTRNNPEIPEFFYGSAEALLANRPDRVTAVLGNGNFSMRNYDFGFFFQDDWKVTQKLTLNLGLRYDFYSNFVSRGRGGTPDAGLWNPSFLSLDGRFDVGPFRPVDSPWEHDPFNLGPRFGFAYNPDGQGKTAIRGGVGLMQTANVAEIGWFATALGPNVPSIQDFGPELIERFDLRFPMVNEQFMGALLQLAQEAETSSVFQIFDPNLGNPYTMQYTLDIQRQLTPNLMFSTAFTGTRGVKFLLYRRGNKPDRLTGLRPNPNLSEPIYTDNSQSLTYFAWQSSLRKRFSRKLSFETNYTWSKGISNSDGDFGAWFTGESPGRGGGNQDFFNVRADRGPTAFDLRHVFAGSWLYELPSLRTAGNRAVQHVLGGWQASGILRASTGLGRTVTQSSALVGDRGDFVGGGPVVLPNHESTLQYLNPDVFRLIPIAPASGAPIRPGNVGVRSIREPGQWTLDFTLAKHFTIQEGSRLQLRTDMFNALNTTNLSGLRTNRNDQFFGQLLSTRGARVIQVGARLTF